MSMISFHIKRPGLSLFHLPSSLFILGIVLLSTQLSFAQTANPSDTLSPLRVVQKYVSGEKFDDKFKYFCCEMQGEWKTDSTLGEILPARVKRDCKLIFADTGHATVDVWMRDSATSKDYYFYLVKDRVWTVYAVRSLLGTANIENDILSLDSVPERSRKRYIAQSGNSWQFEYDNLGLWTSADTVLSENFRKSAKDYDKLLSYLTKYSSYGKTDSLVNTAMTNKKINKLAKSLLLRDIKYSKKYPDCVFFLIGGEGDNSVGYLHVRDGKKPPLMTEKHFIMVKSLGNGWYLFKTT
ncbi:MAG TPA: hypothetical protein VL651_14915 [Bacteroidia bacterium]|jgi:hypothetical protein|nr:hypothetical protein [Bacteroidia bacterium]